MVLVYSPTLDFKQYDLMPADGLYIVLVLILILAPFQLACFFNSVIDI